MGNKGWMGKGWGGGNLKLADRKSAKTQWQNADSILKSVKPTHSDHLLSDVVHCKNSINASGKLIYEAGRPKNV